MTRFLMIFAVVVTLALTLPFSVMASTPESDIQKAETYLRGLDTAKAGFTQRAHNGSKLTGTFYLDRPGKLRFEYNEVEDFIVADGLFIYFFDGELREQTNAPIGQTLADFLLRKDIKLTDDIKVSEIGTEGGLKTYTLQQADDEGAGQVKLFFTEVPFELKKWQVSDAAGLTTEIELHDMQRDVKISNSLFGFIHPDKKPGKLNE